MVVICLFFYACNNKKFKNNTTESKQKVSVELDSHLIATGEKLILVSDEFKFTEGPEVDIEGNVFFTDQPNNRIMKWDASTNSVSVYMQPAGRSNGLSFDNDGNLLACADDKFELWQIDTTKNVTLLVDNYKNKNLNGPNDLWIDAKGGIYFTDPYYQRPYWDRTEQDMKEENVYYLLPDKNSLTPVVQDFVKPNGIIGNADGSMLYIADFGDEKIYSYAVNEDASLSEKTLFVEAKCDGMTIDNQGNIYNANNNGVTVFNPDGHELLNIPTGKNWTANVTFAGPGTKYSFYHSIRRHLYA